MNSEATIIEYLFSPPLVVSTGLVIFVILYWVISLLTGLGLDAIDFDLMIKHLNDLINGKEILVPIYNYKNQSDEYEVIKNSIDVYKKITKKNGCLRINNLELFISIVNQLQVPPRWKARVLNEIYNKKYFYEVLKILESNIDETKVQIDKKLYSKMKKLNPNTLIGNRTVKDILNRFETKVYKQPRPLDAKKSVKIIKKFLKLKCPIEKAPKLLSEFFEKNRLNIKISNDYFPIKKNKIGNLRIEFNSSEIPDVEIYSGLYFSISNRKFVKIISGGAFNKLSSSLGLRPINAVGAAFNISQ